MKLQSALAMAARGFKVFPLVANTKFPPKDFPWKERATTDEATIRGWWGEDPDHNIGVATGAGVVVIDADMAKGRPGLDSLDMLDMLGLPGSLRVATPSGGVHVYLKTDHQFANRVDTIADYPGLDLRGENGYVLAPGSTIDGKAYRAVGETDLVAQAPQWIEDAIARSAAEHRMSASEQPLVELDLPEHVAKATAWLHDSAQEAVEGAGGDQSTYEVACRLRDLGISEPLALELMLEHWNEAKASPPWQPDDLEKKVANAYRYSTGGWGAGTAAGEFGVVDIDIGEGPKGVGGSDTLDQTEGQKGIHFLTYAEMEAMPEPKWLIEGVIQERTSALIFGKSNTFKSFLDIDMGLSVATGRPWHGAETAKGRVLFVATEGANGVGRLRIPGWYDHHNVPLSERGNAYLYPKEIRLDVKEDVNALIAECLRIGAFSLINLDIFGGTMAGTEVEDTTARAWVHSVQKIMRATGAAVLTVAHTGWQDETRARMHTHFWGSFDSRMRVEGDKEKMTTCLTVERHKDADSSGAWGFRLEPVGETLVPVYDETIEPRKGNGWPESLKTAMRALDEAIEAHGQVKIGGAWPMCRVVDTATWRTFCDNLGLSNSDKADTRSKAFKRAKEGLLKRNAIALQEDFIWSKFDVGA